MRVFVILVRYWCRMSIKFIYIFTYDLNLLIMFYDHVCSYEYSMHLKTVLLVSMNILILPIVLYYVFYMFMKET